MGMMIWSSCQLIYREVVVNSMRKELMCSEIILAIDTKTRG